MAKFQEHEVAKIYAFGIFQFALSDAFHCHRRCCTGCDYDWEFRRCECISCSASPTVVVPVTPPPSSVSPPVTAAPGPKSCGRDSCGLCYKLLATPLTTLRLE
ncbi:unnamed protein product [Aphanomyces euteiches]